MNARQQRRRENVLTGKPLPLRDSLLDGAIELGWLLLVPLLCAVFFVGWLVAGVVVGVLAEVAVVALVLAGPVRSDLAARRSRST